MAKKETYYFSHDYNPRADFKIQKLIFKLGYEGYGLFWALIENLYNNANALHLDYDCIAYELRSDSDKIKSVINDFDLFVIDNNIVSSISVGKRLQERENKSIKASKSASSRWDNANALQTKTNRNAIKERKGKEIKEKEIIKGISFSDDKLKVIFPDGTSQILGESQLSLVKANMTNPSQIVKGLIY